MKSISELLEKLSTLRSEREVEVLGNENLGLACEALIAGRGVLVYSNFPHIDAVYQLLRVHWLMASFGQKSCKLMPGVVYDALSVNEEIVSSIAPVYRYLQIKDSRSTLSMWSVMTAVEVLKSGGLVTTMPEIILSETLVKADASFGRLILVADLVLPIVFDSSEDKLKMEFMYPFSTTAVDDIEQIVGKSATGNLAADYLMAMVASKLPVERRGHFANDASWFLDKARKGRFELLKI